MPRHSAILRFCRPVRDHHLLANVCPGLCLCPGPGHAQRPPSTQTANQLTLESPSALDVERLVDGFVRNAHGFVIRKVGLQSIGNLFGRPTIDPFAVTAMRLVSSYERRLHRTRNVTALSVANLALQPVLHVVAQLWISRPFGWLGSFGKQLRLPLRNRSAILKTAATSCTVTCYFRETVDGLRPIRRAISRIATPWHESSPISSRSTNDRYRPDIGLNMESGMPPL